MVQTPNIKLEKPAEGTRPWTDAVNGNWDKIDEAVHDVNTALNLCALTDLSNISTEGKALVASLAAPSTRLTTLSVPTNNGSLKAPSDGYFVLRGVAETMDSFITLTLESGDSRKPYLNITVSPSAVNRIIAAFIPAYANSSVRFNYGSLTGNTGTPKSCLFCKMKGAE